MSVVNQTVMITGAVGAVGRYLADSFRSEGANLVLVDFYQERLAAAFGKDDTRQLLAAVDLSDPIRAQELAKLAFNSFGKIDVLFNLGGDLPAGREMELADWDFLFDINVRDMLHAIRAVVPLMLEQGGGKIINVGSLSLQLGRDRIGPHRASKGSVLRFTESLSSELCEHNINVNCVLPYASLSLAQKPSLSDADRWRCAAQADLANVIRFLASEGASALHGVMLPVRASVDG